MYHEYESFERAQEAINLLNLFWGLDPNMSESSFFSDKDITNFKGKYLIKHDINWTNILGSPIQITIETQEDNPQV